MTERELRKLSRRELLQMLLEMSGENEKLRGRVKNLGGEDAEETETAQEDPRLPGPETFRAALSKAAYRRRFMATLRSTVSILLVVAAIAVLVATLYLPVLQIYGQSMTPTLSEGNVVVSVKTSRFHQGDVVSFYYNNKILVKRVIAYAGDWVDIDDEGNVSVNGTLLTEPYVSEKAKGECDIRLPYQVPDGRIFVIGDHRATSVDSRSTSVGCVADEQIVGRIIFRVWPFSEFGPV